MTSKKTNAPSGASGKSYPKSAARGGMQIVFDGGGERFGFQHSTDALEANLEQAAEAVRAVTPPPPALCAAILQNLLQQHAFQRATALAARAAIIERLNAHIAWATHRTEPVTLRGTIFGFTKSQESNNEP